MSTTMANGNDLRGVVATPTAERLQFAVRSCVADHVSDRSCAALGLGPRTPLGRLVEVEQKQRVAPRPPRQQSAYDPGTVVKYRRLTFRDSAQHRPLLGCV